MFERSAHARSRLRRLSRSLPAAVILVLVVVSAAVAAPAVSDGGGATSFGATFEARAPRTTTSSCAGLGPAGQKVEARYEGTFSIPSQERQLAARLSLVILIDARTGVGSAEGTWRLVSPPDPEIVGRGELLGVVDAAILPDTDLEPPDPDLVLRGMLIGFLEPPDPDMPAQRLLGNFSAVLTDGALSLTGAVGNALSDPPTDGELLPAVLTAPKPC